MITTSSHIKELEAINGEILHLAKLVDASALVVRSKIAPRRKKVIPPPVQDSNSAGK